MKSVINLNGLRATCVAAVESMYRATSAWVQQRMLARRGADAAAAGRGGGGRNDVFVIDIRDPPARRGQLMQSLEGRQMLAAVSLSGGLLTITGDSSTVVLSANLDSTGSKIVARTGNTYHYYARSSVTAVKIVGGSAAELMSVTKSVGI